MTEFVIPVEGGLHLHPLYKLTSKGEIQTWHILVKGSTIYTYFGLAGGKIQEAVDVVREGKNIGKANETTPEQQAMLEAQSKWEKQVKKGYVQKIEDAKQGRVDETFVQGGIDPMLAHPFSKQGHKIVYPAYVQPKLDGHRCIAMVENFQTTLWSRTRKPINSVPHIQDALGKIIRVIGLMSPPVILDGELYNHDYRDDFDTLTSLIRQTQPKPGHEAVQYHIYDIADSRDFKGRSTGLSYLMGIVDGLDLTDVIKIVPTRMVENQDELMESFSEFLLDGYEGAMVRNASGLYANRRSYDLQKVKEFDDSEFEIVDVNEGRGKMTGKAIFVCKTADGSTFGAKMTGKLDDLREYFENKNAYVGQMLTVKYQGLTPDGIPRFPVGLRVRENL